MNPVRLLETQQTLRRSLFEGPEQIRWEPGHALAAQLLLHLDDLRACWLLSASWFGEQVGADRVDAGPGGYVDARGRAHDYVACVEIDRCAGALPPVLGRPVDPTEPGLKAMRPDTVVRIPAISRASSMSGDMRRSLTSAGIGAKLSLPLNSDGRWLGIVCADWRRPQPDWSPATCGQLADIARDVIGPILMAATRLARADAPSMAYGDPLTGLTPAERRLAGLAADGLSYKEMAGLLGRSPATIDHQLRSIRAKLGVRSTSRLVHLLNQGVVQPRCGASSAPAPGTTCASFSRPSI